MYRGRPRKTSSERKAKSRKKAFVDDEEDDSDVTPLDSEDEGNDVQDTKEDGESGNQKNGTTTKTEKSKNLLQNQHHVPFTLTFPPLSLLNGCASEAKTAMSAASKKDAENGAAAARDNANSLLEVDEDYDA